MCMHRLTDVKSLSNYCSILSKCPRVLGIHEPKAQGLTYNVHVLMLLAFTLPAIDFNPDAIALHTPTHGAPGSLEVIIGCGQTH